MFLGYESLWSSGSRVAQEGLVRLPTELSESSPSDFELHGRSSIAVASVAED
jgi:hypothetical protein